MSHIGEGTAQSRSPACSSKQGASQARVPRLYEVASLSIPLLAQGALLSGAGQIVVIVLLAPPHTAQEIVLICNGLQQVRLYQTNVVQLRGGNTPGAAAALLHKHLQGESSTQERSHPPQAAVPGPRLVPVQSLAAARAPCPSPRAGAFTLAAGWWRRTGAAISAPVVGEVSPGFPFLPEGPLGSRPAWHACGWGSPKDQAAPGSWKKTALWSSRPQENLCQQLHHRLSHRREQGHRRLSFPTALPQATWQSVSLPALLCHCH